MSKEDTLTKNDDKIQAESAEMLHLVSDFNDNSIPVRVSKSQRQCMIEDLTLIKKRIEADSLKRYGIPTQSEILIVTAKAPNYILVVWGEPKSYNILRKEGVFDILYSEFIDFMAELERSVKKGELDKLLNNEPDSFLYERLAEKFF